MSNGGGNHGQNVHEQAMLRRRINESLRVGYTKRSNPTAKAYGPAPAAPSPSRRRLAVIVAIVVVVFTLAFFLF